MKSAIFLLLSDLETSFYVRKTESSLTKTLMVLSPGRWTGEQEILSCLLNVHLSVFQKYIVTPTTVCTHDLLNTHKWFADFYILRSVCPSANLSLGCKFCFLGIYMYFWPHTFIWHQCLPPGGLNPVIWNGPASAWCFTRRYRVSVCFFFGGGCFKFPTYLVKWIFYFQISFQPRPTKGKMRIHCLENVDKALTFLHEQRVHLENMGAHDIVDGSSRLTLGLIWTIILRFQVSYTALDM